MSRPTDAGSFAEAVYTQMTPVTYMEDDPSINYALLKFLGGLGQMFQSADTIAHDENGVPWSAMVDINRCPIEGLTWLGQLIGVVVDQSLTDNDKRQQIRQHDGWDRCSLPALNRALRAVVGDDVSFQIIERSTDAYHLDIIVDVDTGAFTYSGLYSDTNYSEIMMDWPTYQVMFTASGGSDILDPIIAAAMSQKPASIILSVTAGSAVPNVISIWGTNTIYNDLWLAWQTYGHVYSYYLAY